MSISTEKFVIVRFIVYIMIFPLAKFIPFQRGNCLYTSRKYT